MAAEKPGKIDGHRLSEFVYGLVTGMVAAAGVKVGADTSWLSAALVIVAGSVAIWAAHGYSIMISKRVTAGRRLTGGEIAEVFSGSWPIVVAGSLLAVPLVPVAFGFYGITVAMDLVSIVGIVLLAGVGLLAGVVTKETWSRRLLLAAVSAGLGVAVVAVELALAHH